MPKTKIRTVPATLTRTAVRIRGGFSAVEEIAWQAERTASPAYRLFYKRLARVARAFHVELNLADASGDLTLPDPTPEDCPSNLWHEIDRAARELELRIPCPAVTVAAMALQGELESGRIEVTEQGRSLLAIPTGKLTTEERQWIETYERAIEETPIEPEPAPIRSPQEISPPQPAKAQSPKITDQELTELAAVLKCFRTGKGYRVLAPCTVIEQTGFAGPRVMELLRQLKEAGRIRRWKGLGIRYVLTSRQ